MEMPTDLSEVLIRGSFLGKHPFAIWFGASRYLSLLLTSTAFSSRDLHMHSLCFMYFRLQVVQYVSWLTQMPLRLRHGPSPPALWPPQWWTVLRTNFGAWLSFGSSCSGEGMFLLLWHFDVDFVIEGVTSRDLEIDWRASGRELYP